MRFHNSQEGDRHQLCTAITGFSTLLCKCQCSVRVTMETRVPALCYRCTFTWCVRRHTCVYLKSPSNKGFIGKLPATARHINTSLHVYIAVHALLLTHTHTHTHTQTNKQTKLIHRGITLHVWKSWSQRLPVRRREDEDHHL